MDIQVKANKFTRSVQMIYTRDGDNIIFNVSSGLMNYSQRNNEYVLSRKVNIVNSTNVCNVTSMCMGASYAGWRFPDKPYPQYKQEEDRLAAFCLSDKRVSAYYKKLYPTWWKEWDEDKKDALPPNQVHEVLAYATNLWFGTNVVKFNEKLTMVDILNEILVNNLPIVVSGSLPRKSDSKEYINHIIVLVGVIFKEEDFIKRADPAVSVEYFSSKNPSHLIFDDPWGNFMEGYEKLKSGNDVVCPYNQAFSYLKPVNSYFKWGHTFTRAPSII
jgi:hypothetical protein